MTGIRKGTIMDDVIFELYDKDDDGLVIKVKYNGVWQIVDNGYLLWSSCVPPLKHYDFMAEQRWSYWVESIRKDVECTFGILKNRWRILKSPIYIQNVDEVDKIWKTCCALHNWLLEVDGRDYEWDCGVGSDNMETNADDYETNSPFAMQRLDLSDMGFGNDRIDDDNDANEIDEYDEITAATGINSIDKNGINVVRDLSLDTFRSKLIIHFDIMYRKKEIVWPKQKTIVNKL